MLLTNKFFVSFDCHNPIAPYCAAVSYVAAVVIAHYFMAVVHLFSNAFGYFPTSVCFRPRRNNERNSHQRGKKTNIRRERFQPLTMQQIGLNSL